MDAQTKNLTSEDSLKRTGLQKTAQRLAVLDIFARAEHPLTASDVFQRVSERQKVNRVTVYRILSSYTSKGIIREFESKRGIHYYEWIEPGIHPHPHFNCRGCGVVICLAADTAVWAQIANRPDFEIESISISGLCDLCRRKNEGNRKTHF